MRDAVWAVVVARVGNGAKSRLAAALNASDRRRLALSMLSDVLRVSSDSNLEGLVAVVDDPDAGRLGEHYGAIVLRDSGSGDMNAAVRAGIATARGNGATTVIVLPGDVPHVARSDFEALTTAASGAPRAVVVGASRDGEGTNALLLRPPDVIAPAFGPPSVERHLRLARANGAAARVVHHLGLALDVDTPADLAALAR